MLPEFIVVGPQKTGTSWLYQCLAEHPEVCLPAGVKETFFFDRYFQRGQQWYERYFSEWKQGMTAGEVAPTYFAAPKSASRIHALCPTAKIIVCFRSPVRRSWSAYLDAWRKGDTSSSFERAVEANPRLLDDSLYSKHLEPYHEKFGRENVLVLINEDFDRDYLGVLATLFRFIGVDEGYRPGAGTRRVNAFRPPRSRALARLSTMATRALHTRGLHAVVKLGKRAGLKKLVYNKAAPSVDLMTESQREELERYFRDEVRQLSALLDRDLEALWLK